MNFFRVYFLKLAASHPAWRFLVSLIHSSVFIFLTALLAVNDILQDDIASSLVLLVPVIIILTYTFFLKRFSNPDKLEELLKLKKEKRNAKSAIKAKRREQIRKEIEKEERDKEREKIKEEKRIKDNYLDIGLGHKLPKTIEKIRNPITDKSVIKIEQGIDRAAFGLSGYEFEFNEYYLKKYMPNLLHEIRKEVIDEFIQQEIAYPYWKRFIEKKYDPSILNEDKKIKFGSALLNDEQHPVHSIIFKNLIKYFQENGWSLSEDIQKEKVLKTIPVYRSKMIYKEVFYLHPPKK